jgi:hypothetical protein
MSRLTDWVGLASQVQWELEENTEADSRDLLELYRLTELDRVDPLDSPELVDLNERVSAWS